MQLTNRTPRVFDSADTFDKRYEDITCMHKSISFLPLRYWTHSNN